MSDLFNIAKYCNLLLRELSEAQEFRNYINDRVSLDIQQQYLFGFFPNSQQLNTLTYYISEKSLIDNNLLYALNIESHITTKQHYKSFFENHQLIIPYYDAYGEVIAFAGRTLLNDKDRGKLGIQKYKNTVFQKSNNLFNLNFAKHDIIKQNKVYLVEGQIDSIKAYEKGIKNVVAVGSSNLSDSQFALLLRYTNNIVLLFDNDESGDKGRSRIVSKYSQYANITQARIPVEYKDIDEFLKTNNADALKNII